MSVQVKCPSCWHTMIVDAAAHGPRIYCTCCGDALSFTGADGRVVSCAPPTRRPRARDHAAVRFAGFWIRLLAALVDGVVLAIPVTVLGACVPLLGETAVCVLYTTLCLGYWNGQTVGKRICGIRVVADDLTPCTVEKALIRSLAEILSGLILCIGYLMVAFDRRKQGLHDKLAGTLHIYA